VTDTVGFIHKLPHQLVDAFRATLEEVTRADVLLEIVDVADRHAPEHRQTVQQVLDDLGAATSRACWPTTRPTWSTRRPRTDDLPAPSIAGSVLVSALTGFGMDVLRARLSAMLADLWEDSRRVAALQRGRAAVARPRAGHGRLQLPRTRRARQGSRGAHPRG
jgi:GTPase